MMSMQRSWLIVHKRGLSPVAEVPKVTGMQACLHMFLDLVFKLSSSSLIVVR